MKKLIAALIMTFAMTALGHEMEGGSTAGLFGLKPEYIHVLLNPLPVYGLAIGIATLGIGLFARNKSTRTVGLIVTFISAASAWPVLFFGQRGYNDLYPLLDTDSQKILDVHMDRAEHFIYFFYATAVLAIAALVASRKFQKGYIPLATLTFLLGAASLGIGGWISRAGGEVSHSEFRSETPSADSTTQTNNNQQPNEKEKK